MKSFDSINEMITWFNSRIFTDDIAFIKNLSQDVVIASDAANLLNVYSGEKLDTSLVLSNIDEISKVDSELLQREESVLVYELWTFERPQMLYWSKRVLCANNQFYILQELHPAVDTNSRSLVGVINVKRNWDYKDIKEKFTEKERAILYLFIHGFNKKQVAEVMFISAGTVKANFYNRIRNKFLNLGFEVPTKELVVEIAGLLGMGDVMPSILIPKVNPTTKIIKRYVKQIAIPKYPREFDFRF